MSTKLGLMICGVDWGGISCEAAIRAGCGRDQEVSSVLSVISAVWPATQKTDKISRGSVEAWTDLYLFSLEDWQGERSASDLW